MTEKALPDSFGREAERDAAAAAEERDAVARERDLATQDRDVEAERRDRDADSRDGAADAADPALELRAASDRQAAAGDRARAAGARTEAAQDRKQATLDRQGAADAREQASLDRQGAADDRALAARHLADIERVAQLGSWEWFVDGDEMVWTDGLYRVFGLEPGSEATEAAFLERLHPDDRPMVESLVQHSLETREPFKYQTRIVRPGGEIVRVQAYGEVALGPDGQLRGLSGTLMDITERHIAATGERARLEADLHRAQRLDSVGQLAGGIAHDFNNILVVVQSYAEFALAETDGAVREDIEEIRRAAERAASLTRQLLVFSRREVVAPEAVDLNGVVSETEKLLARTLGAHVELVVDRAPGLPAIKADRGQLEQVLVNLALNARDAMPGGGRLTIRTRTVSQGAGASEEAAAAGGRYISLTVSDTGTGMSREVRERAFEPFFTTKDSSHGTGLGLATVSGIVAQSGGTVRLESEVGAGTTVTVRLPVTAERPGTPPTQKEGSPRGSGELVLVAEDEAPVGALTCRILEAHDYRVLYASCGEEALELCRAHGESIDLLLTDSVMPAMAGSVLAQEALELIPSLRVLYMSGYIDGKHVGHGTSPGGPGLLQKPFGKDSLLRYVAQALHPACPADPAPPS